MAHIYIAFVDTPGLFATMIRHYLKQRFVHVVISNDALLTESYSVGRRHPAVPLIAGFEKENKEEILQSFPTAYYRICALSCSAIQKKRIMKRLRNDYDRRFHIHYAVLALPFLIHQIPFFIKNRYTCSSYIAQILSEEGIMEFDKHFSLVTPKDFYQYSGWEVVFEGNLSEIMAQKQICSMGSVAVYE